MITTRVWGVGVKRLNRVIGCNDARLGCRQSAMGNHLVASVHKTLTLEGELP
jgi:hypothetical protein